MRASTRASGPLRSGKCVGHGTVSSWWEDVAQARQHARHHRRGRGGEADQSCAVAIFVAKPISGTEAVRARGFQYSKRCGGMCTGTSCGRAVDASQVIQSPWSTSFGLDASEISGISTAEAFIGSNLSFGLRAYSIACVSGTWPLTVGSTLLWFRTNCRGWRPREPGGRTMNYEGTQESAEMSYSDVFEIVNGLDRKSTR